MFLEAVRSFHQDHILDHVEFSELFSWEGDAVGYSDATLEEIPDRCWLILLERGMIFPKHQHDVVPTIAISTTRVDSISGAFSEI